jgi:hypothetical protein
MIAQVTVFDLTVLFMTKFEVEYMHKHPVEVPYGSGFLIIFVGFFERVLWLRFANSWGSIVCALHARARAMDILGLLELKK